MSSEWILLQESEAIEKGDRIWVERENGKRLRLRFIKIEDDKYVILKDGLGELHRFCVDSLEEQFGEDRIIIGKVEEE